MPGWKLDARIALIELAGTVPDLPERRCAGCGEPFETSDPRQRYCSIPCRERVKKQGQRAQRTPDLALVKTLESVANRHPYHPETKRNGPDGKICDRRTEGLLSRRVVHGAGGYCMGKESHRLTEWDIIRNPDEVQYVLTPPDRDRWYVYIVPRLRTIAAEPGGMERLAKIAGMTPRRFRVVVAGKGKPRRAARLALIQLVESGESVEPKRCPTCGIPIETTDPRQRYCSTRCRRRTEKQRQRSRVDPA